MTGRFRCSAQGAAVSPQRRRQTGFTMVELIIVLVLIGVLAALGAGRFADRKDFDAAGFAEQTRSMLRHAQKLAIAQNRSVHVLIEASRISLCFNAGACPAASRVPAPAGGNSGSSATRAACASTTWFCEGRPAGVTLASAGTLPASLSFDALGRPSAGLALTVGGSGAPVAVNVAPETGYVH
ncbi:type II secretion system GspH family protein [Massilia oculi]|uniref:Type II secretion system GspH family protein n=1 Tax=Massilia hydrophila TaxID=3044279 RepID=A0ABS7Y982_9BURK|nr:type II secretion system GspH family protein [Massilia oculi]